MNTTCKNCNKPISDDDIKCPSCGHVPPEPCTKGQSPGMALGMIGGIGATLVLAFMGSILIYCGLFIAVPVWLGCLFALDSHAVKVSARTPGFARGLRLGIRLQILGFMVLIIETTIKLHNWYGVQ